MKKSKIFVLIVSVLLALSLTACSTVTIVIPYDSVAGLFGGTAGTPNTDGTTNNTPVNSDQTAAPDNTSSEADTSAPDNSTAPSETTTASPSDNTTTAPSESTTAAPESTTATPAESTTAAPTSKVPSTKDEIIAYYVEAYNKIATDGKTFTRTYDYTSNYNNILEISNNPTLEGLAKTAMGSFMKENSDAVTGTANDIPPVGVNKLSISSGQIGTATINDKGSYYEVVLTSTGSDSNYEIDAKAGSGSAGVIGVLLRSEDVDGKVPGVKFDGLHSWYGTAKLTVKIDKASGHITELNYYTPCVLHFDQVTAAVVIKVANCNIGLLFQQTWKIGY